MICSKCGGKCDNILIADERFGYASCTSAVAKSVSSCCQADILHSVSSSEPAYTRIDIKAALNKVGISGWVQKRILDEIRGDV